MTSKSPAARTVLFLQGPPSLFLRDLAVELSRHGVRTRRINLNLGDWLFWPRRGADNYRGPLRNWRDFLTDYIARHGVTDIVYYADRLPYHVIAGEVGRAAGVSTIAREFGYLRPDWITLERNGMSAYSHFPNDPDVIRELGKDLVVPSAASLYAFPHAKEAFCEVLYNLTAYFGRPFYPSYYGDRIYNPVIEYLSHIPRILSTRGNLRRSHAVLDELIDSGTPYYLFALQIDADYQLRANAPFRKQPDAVKLAISSFAKHAPKNTVLLFKQHPLDNAMTHWKLRIQRLSRRYKVSDRIRFIRAGNLGEQLTHARGTVLINSTVGVHALKHGCPVKTLGVALYDMPGLTFQGPLDDFWTTTERPDPDLCNAFVAVMANTIQVRGNFYSRAGRKAGAEAAALRILEDRINEPGAYVDVPPRLERARRMGLQPADDLGRQIPQRGLIEPENE